MRPRRLTHLAQLALGLCLSMTADVRASQYNAGAARTWSSGRAAQRVAIVWYVAQGLSSRSLRPAVTLDLQHDVRFRCRVARHPVQDVAIAGTDECHPPPRTLGVSQRDAIAPGHRCPRPGGRLREVVRPTVAGQSGGENCRPPSL